MRLPLAYGLVAIPETTRVTPLSRALHEALASVAAPSHADELVRCALREAGLDVVPEDLDRFRAFLAGPMLGRVESALGSDAADMVGEELQQLLGRMMRILARATGTDDDDPSGERCVEGLALHDAATRTPTPTRARPDIAAALRAPLRNTPTDIGPLEAPLIFPRARTNESGTQRKGAAIARVSSPGVRESTPGRAESVRATPMEVLVVTLDLELVADVVREMPAGTRVVAIATNAELVQAIARAARKLAVVLDATLPAIDAPTFARHASALPASTKVILWGIDDRQKARLTAMFPQTAGWVAGGDHATPAALLPRE